MKPGRKDHHCSYIFKWQMSQETRGDKEWPLACYSVYLGSDTAEAVKFVF